MSRKAFGNDQIWNDIKFLESLLWPYCIIDNKVFLFCDNISFGQNLLRFHIRIRISFIGQVSFHIVPTQSNKMIKVTVSSTQGKEIIKIYKSLITNLSSSLLEHNLWQVKNSIQAEDSDAQTVSPLSKALSSLTFFKNAIPISSWCVLKINEVRSVFFMLLELLKRKFRYCSWILINPNYTQVVLVFISFFAQNKRECGDDFASRTILKCLFK